MRVGLVGLGGIGLGILRLSRARPQDNVEVVAALVVRRDRPRPQLAPATVFDLEALMAKKPEVVVDAAGHAALRAYGSRIVAAGCDLIVLSVGALADQDLFDELRAAAQGSGARVRIAPGAVAGIDAIRAAALDGLETVTHVIRKPARVLLGDEAAELKESKELYRGSARDGVGRFPESANVVATVSLAGIGFDRTEMRVVADPSATRNVHEVMAAGRFGQLRVVVENVPTEENPRTGRLAALSAYRMLLDRDSHVRIG